MFTSTKICCIDDTTRHGHMLLAAYIPWQPHVRKKCHAVWCSKLSDNTRGKSTVCESSGVENGTR